MRTARGQACAMHRFKYSKPVPIAIGSNENTFCFFHSERSGKSVIYCAKEIYSSLLGMTGRSKTKRLECKAGLK